MMEAGDKVFFFTPLFTFLGVLVPLEVTIMRVDDKRNSLSGEGIIEYTVKDEATGKTYTTEPQWLKLTPQ